MVGVVPSYAVEHNAACYVYLARWGWYLAIQWSAMLHVLHTWHGGGGTQLYSGVQCCTYCIPTMVGVVPSYTVECNAAGTAYLARWGWYLVRWGWYLAMQWSTLLHVLYT